MTTKQQRWLNKAVEELRPLFRRAGYRLPRCITVAYRRCQQAHWYGEAYTTFTDYNIVRGRINIDPKVRVGRKILLVLVHELSHIAANRKTWRYNEHGDPAYEDCVARIGLQPRGGYPAKPGLDRQIRRLRRRLGPFQSV